ncbi:MAG: hypothetical protein N3A69_06545, partial [Leptospiraceae bacterium]|nr:hypothetical protein [Leptospiraceae bacterium]
DRCFSYFQLPRNGYKFNINEKSTIITKKGTRITIPPSAFLYTNFANATGIATLYVYEVTEAFEYMIAGVNHIYYDKSNKASYLELAGMIKLEAMQDNVRLRIVNDKPIEIEFPDLSPNKRVHFFMLDESGNWVIKKQYGEYEIFKPTENKENLTGTRKGWIEYLTWYAFGILNPEAVLVQVEWSDPKRLSSKNFHVVGIGLDHLSYFSKWTENFQAILPLFPGKKFRVFVCDTNGNLASSEEFLATPQKFETTTSENPPPYQQLISLSSLDKFPRENFASPEKFKAYLQIPKNDYTVQYKIMELPLKPSPEQK